MLTTDQKGAIAESAIVHAATKLGVGVYNRNNQPSGINWAEDFAFEARLRTLLGP